MQPLMKALQPENAAITSREEDSSLATAVAMYIGYRAKYREQLPAKYVA